MEKMTDLQRLFRCIGQEIVSIDAMWILARPMANMTLQQKEERAAQIMALIDESQNEQELLLKAKELHLI